MFDFRFTNRPFVSVEGLDQSYPHVRYTGANDVRTGLFGIITRAESGTIDRRFPEAHLQAGVLGEVVVDHVFGSHRRIDMLVINSRHDGLAVGTRMTGNFADVCLARTQEGLWDATYGLLLDPNTNVTVTADPSSDAAEHILAVMDEAAPSTRHRGVYTDGHLTTDYIHAQALHVVGGPELDMRIRDLGKQLVSV